MDVLVDLDEQERRAEQERRQDARPCRPKRLPCLADSSAQCIVSDEESRIAVLTPAIAFGSSVPCAGHGVALHDPDEEVGREEGPEDHHLGDDEKQHPEQLRARPARSGCAGGGPWCSSSAWACATRRSRRLPSGLPPAAVASTRRARPACRSRCSTRSMQLVGDPPGARPRAASRSRSRRCGSSCTRVHRRRVADPGRRSCPAATRPASSQRRRAASRRRSRAARGGLAVARVLRHDDDEEVRAVRRPSSFEVLEQLGPARPSGWRPRA